MGQSTSPSNGKGVNSRAVEPTASDFPVQIRIQRTVILAGGLVCIVLTTITMWLCVSGGGTVIETFLSTAKDKQTRKTLLNAYNSYLGSLTAVFIKSVELFLAMALAVGLLCFAT